VLEVVESNETELNPGETTQPGSGDQVPATEQQQVAGEGGQQVQEQQAEGQGEQAPGGLKSRTREYIRQLTREKHEAARRAENAEATSRALARQLEETRSRRPQVESPEQIVERVATDAVETGRARALQAQAETEQGRAKDIERQIWSEMASDGRTRFPDFDQKIGNPNLAISEEMVQTLFELDEGTDILYYLGSNPREADRISALPKRSQAIALTQLVNKLPSKTAAVRAKTSSAPAPVKVLNSGAGNSAAPLAEMTMEQYIQARQGGRVS